MYASTVVLICSSPVSYTHLDVYKRQTLRLSAWECYYRINSITGEDLKEAQLVLQNGQECLLQDSEQIIM